MVIFFFKHDAIDIADPSSMQDACHMNFVIDLAHLRVCGSVVEHGNAEPGVWGSIPHGNLEFFLYPTLMTRWKTSFSLKYSSPWMPKAHRNEMVIWKGMGWRKIV